MSHVPFSIPESVPYNAVSLGGAICSKAYALPQDSFIAVRVDTQAKAALDNMVLTMASDLAEHQVGHRMQFCLLPHCQNDREVLILCHRFV